MIQLSRLFFDTSRLCRAEIHSESKMNLPKNLTLKAEEIEELKRLNQLLNERNQLLSERNQALINQNQLLAKQIGQKWGKSKPNCWTFA
jgi:hypothetical protein